MSDASPTTYRFGPFELRTIERQLLRDGQPLALGARAFDLLRTLVEQAGALVTKEALLERAWPGLVVEEANVHVQVSQLRKLLGADAVGTVAGIGYRFTLPLLASSPARALPAERTPFVGRETALADARQRLASTRLLSLIGIGGTGKTRLAMKLAERMADERAVCWVDLVPVESAEALLAAVMQAAGCASNASASTLEALAAHLQGRAALLVLDNCEHLLDPVASLIDRLLAAVPSLSVVATSREALDLPGEAVMAVRPLELPLPGADASEAAGSEALRLFAQRARLASPGFALDEERTAAALAVCRQLDGIPLALELAAAQLRVLSLDQLQGLIGERLRQLSGSQRTPPRQQTLAAVLQWSHDHLRPQEQRLLQQLAVCAGGCDLEAVEALCAAPGDDAVAARAAVLDGLARLADRSLIEVRQGSGIARYMLLETVRQDALARLQDAGGLHVARERHAAHFLAFAQAAQAEIGGRGEAMLQRLDTDRDNLLRALDWWDREGDAEAARHGLQLVVALRGWWPARGTSAIGLTRTLAAVERSRILPHDAMRGIALATATHLLWQSGDYAKAWSLAEEHALLAEAAGDGEGASLARIQLGNIASSQRRLPEARHHYEQALAQARALGLETREGDALHGMASIAAAELRLDDAQRLYDEVLAMRRREAQDHNLATALANNASTAMDRGDAVLARERMLELLGLLEPLGSRYVALHTIRLTGKLLALLGDGESATCLSATAQRIRDETGQHWNQAAGKEWNADLTALRSSLGDGAYDAAWRQGLAMDDAAAIALGVERLRA